MLLRTVAVWIIKDFNGVRNVKSGAKIVACRLGKKWRQTVNWIITTTHLRRGAYVERSEKLQRIAKLKVKWYTALTNWGGRRPNQKSIALIGTANQKRAKYWRANHLRKQSFESRHSEVRNRYTKLKIRNRLNWVKTYKKGLKIFEFTKSRVVFVKWTRVKLHKRYFWSAKTHINPTRPQIEIVQ